MPRSAGAAHDAARVILVEDDIALGRALKFALSAAGFITSLHYSAEAMLANNALDDCRCIVTDLHLPGASGIDLITSLRKQGLDRPLILMTTQPTALIKRQVSAAGALLVEKPILGDRLIEAISAAR